MIETTVNKVVYNADGSTRTFSVPFDIINYSTDLNIFVSDKNTEELINISKNFSFDEQNKTVTYPTIDSGLAPLPVGKQLILIRETQITQEKDHNAQLFKSKDVEQMTDKLTMISQDLKEMLNRAVLSPVNTDNNNTTFIGTISNEIKKHNENESSHPYLLEKTTTLRNDLDDLGEQVSGIEEKIPESASGTNNLVTKQQLIDTELNITEDLSQEIQSKIYWHDVSTQAHPDIRQAIEALQLLKLVDVLPAQGESKYIYAVPQDERTTDGQLIVVLFIWTGTEWAAVGALTTSVDWSEYLKKTEAQNTYLPKQNPSASGTAKIQSVLQLVNDEGVVTFSLVASDINYIQNLSKRLGVPPGYEISRYSGTGYSDNVLWSADKGVSGGVASLGTDGKVPQEQLPNISAATPVTGLGQVTSASFEVNKNYAASVSGTAAFALPTPADSTIANKITLSLNVLANSVINWGANVNAALAEFTPGKYQIRLLWNNTSSAWSAEVLKETEASSPVKLLIRFNGAISDESASPLTLAPSRTLTAFPVYAEGQYGQQKLTCTGDSADNYVTASGNNLPKLNLGTGDFTIKCWLTLASTYSYPVRIFYKDDNNQISVGNDRIHVRFGGALVLNQAIRGVATGDTAYITLTRQNGTLYFFVNGSLVHSQASAEEWDLSGFTQIFKGSGVAGVGHYGIQELIVKNTCDYVADFTAPSTPFILADSVVSDLHDADLSSLAIKAVTPNYSAGQTVENVTSGSWTNVAKTSMVICYATDSYMENYEVKVSPDNGTTAYVVGKRYDDANEKTQGTSFSFIVPAGWSFTSTNEGTYSAYIYPLGV